MKHKRTEQLKIMYWIQGLQNDTIWLYELRRDYTQAQESNNVTLQVGYFCTSCGNLYRDLEKITVANKIVTAHCWPISDNEGNGSKYCPNGANDENNITNSLVQKIW